MLDYSVLPENSFSLSLNKCAILYDNHYPLLYPRALLTERNRDLTVTA